MSQQLKAARDLSDVHPDVLLRTASPILVDVSQTKGFDRLAVFGWVAHGHARPDSDIDLPVDATAGSAITELVGLRDTFREILGRPVDLITYGGLEAVVDDDLRSEAVLL